MATNQKTVCIIEDDPDVRDSLDAVISTFGYSCRTFESAEALLARTDDCHCDFFIIDVNLPEMSGPDLLKSLRDSGDDTPAIFYSGRVDDRVLNAAMSLGDVPVIQKGNNIKKITEYIRACLGDDEA